VSVSRANQNSIASYDVAGVSTIFSTRTTSDSRPGAFFDADFSAVVPTYFHQMDQEHYLGLFSRRWYGATRPTNATSHNFFSAYSIDASPSWAIFNASNGHHLPIPGQFGINPPTAVPYSSRVLVGACSKGSVYLYMLQSYNASGETFGVVSLFNTNSDVWNVNLVGEEKIPNIVVGSEKIIFDRGIRCTDTHLNFAGRDSLNRVYLARKEWGFVGKFLKFEYQSEAGWTEDPLKIKPLKTPTGDLVSAGPISFCNYGGKVWASVVVDNSPAAMGAQVYGCRGMWEAWVPENLPYSLGQGTSYIGGLCFQPMLRADPSKVGETCTTAIPLTYATVQTTGSNSALNVSWDLWPVPVYGLDRKLSSEAVLDVAATPGIAW
jgi:hypothetical protein